jgi:tripartite-type tricarboxylate transporter receptor subunit TctC
MKFSSLWALSACLVLGSGAVFAQTWPEPGVKLVVPLTPGSGADTAARALAQSLGKAWKQTVVVDNKPGAGGLIGTSAVVTSEATGHTLLVQSAGYAANPAIHKKLPYDPHKSLVAVAYLGVTPYVMVTAPDGPYKSLQDLVAAARERPGDVVFTSVGVGSSTHFAAEAVAQAAGIKLLHVPHKGGPEAIQEVMAGRAAFTMAALSTALGHIKGGKLRALGVSTPSRSDAAPEIATIAEQGFKDFDIALWFGLWAPAGTPAAVVQRINTDIRQAQQDPEVQATFGRLGIRARAMTTTEFSTFVSNEITKHAAIAKAAQIDPK